MPWYTTDDARRDAERMGRAARDTPRCNCCGYLVTEREHFGCLRAANNPLSGEEVADLLPIMQDGWTLAEYGMWVARAIERAHGIKTPNYN